MAINRRRRCRQYEDLFECLQRINMASVARVMETILLSGALGHQCLTSELSRFPFYFCGSAEASEINEIVREPSYWILFSGYSLKAKVMDVRIVFFFKVLLLTVKHRVFHFLLGRYYRLKWDINVKKKKKKNLGWPVILICHKVSNESIGNVY